MPERVRRRWSGKTDQALRGRLVEPVARQVGIDRNVGPLAVVINGARLRRRLTPCTRGSRRRAIIDGEVSGVANPAATG